MGKGERGFWGGTPVEHVNSSGMKAERDRLPPGTLLMGISWELLYTDETSQVTASVAVGNYLILIW